MNTASAPRTGSASSVAKDSRPSRTFLATSSGSPARSSQPALSQPSSLLRATLSPAPQGPQRQEVRFAPLTLDNGPVTTPTAEDGRTMDNPILVEVTRGPQVESWH